MERDEVLREILALIKDEARDLGHYGDRPSYAARIKQHADATLALLASVPEREPDGWRPVETAPQDGTDILLTDGRVVTYGGWITDMDQGADYEGQLHCAGWWSVAGDVTPTHWMPLPAAPAAQAAESEGL
jgi:hypothetical protein